MQINIGQGLLLFGLFLGLKLAHVTDWAWVWVFSPLWIQPLDFLVAFCQDNKYR